ncbi:MAG: hypothetical protein Cons2KO_11540 [Congregibacter sp.]
MKRLFIDTHLLLFTATMLVAASTAGAQEFESGETATPLLELYTSEGCSSCPPADRWLSGLRHSPQLWRDVVPIAFHVDYWNYLGWDDRFSSPHYAQRQREYRRQNYVQGVYTPGVMLGGEEWRRWRGVKEIPAIGGIKPGSLHLKVDDKGFTANFEADTSLSDKASRLHLAILGTGLKTAVRAGENRGRELVHDFVVLGYQHYDTDGAAWQGALPEVPDRFQPEQLAIAAWVSRGSDVIPVQALGGWLTAAP